MRGCASTFPNQFPNPNDAKLNPAGNKWDKLFFWSLSKESKDEESRLFSVTYLPTVPTVEAATIFINELVESFRMPEYSETAEVIASSLSPLPKIK